MFLKFQREGPNKQARHDEWIANLFLSTSARATSLSGHSTHCEHQWVCRARRTRAKVDLHMHSNPVKQERSDNSIQQASQRQVARKSQEVLKQISSGREISSKLGWDMKERKPTSRVKDIHACPWPALNRLPSYIAILCFHMFRFAFVVVRIQLSQHLGFEFRKPCTPKKNKEPSNIPSTFVDSNTMILPATKKKANT